MIPLPSVCGRPPHQHLGRAAILLLAVLGATCPRAATLLFSEDFESATSGQRPPVGWSLAVGGPIATSGTLQANINRVTDGINSSAKMAKVYTFDTAIVQSSAIDLTGHTSGETITLAFDLFVPTTTTDYNLLLGFGAEGGGPDYWSFASPNAAVAFGVTALTYSTAGIWERLSLDITPAATYFAENYPASMADFRIKIETPNLTGAINNVSVGGGNFIENAPWFDNITVTAASAVPEPSTFGVWCGIALSAWALHRRRRQGTRLLAMHSDPKKIEGGLESTILTACQR